VGTKHNVDAEFRLKGVDKAKKSVDTLADSMSDLGSKIRGSSHAATGMIATITGVAGAYFGIHALKNAFASAAHEAVGFHAELEATRVGLAAVMSAVDHVPFEQAKHASEAMMESLREDSLNGMASLQELASSYSMLAGPMRSAGSSMEEIRDLTNQTVLATTALGLDMGFASNEISHMVQGAAGMNHNLFRTLHSMGLIKEDASEFNNLAPEKRIEKIRKALDVFSGSADTYKNKWQTLMKSFHNIKVKAMSDLFGPAIKVFQTFMVVWRAKITAAQRTIERRIKIIGEKMAGVFSKVIAKAEQGLIYVADRWDSIIKSVGNVATRLQSLAPKMLEAAKIYAGIQIGREVVGASLEHGGALMEKFKKVVELTKVSVEARKYGGEAVAKGAGAANDLFRKGGLIPKNLFKIPDKAIAGEAAMSSLGLGGGIAGGSGVGAVTMFMEAIAPLSAILAPLIGMLLVVKDHWKSLVGVFEEFMSGAGAGIGEVFVELFQNMYAVVAPFLKMLGFFVGLGIGVLVGILVGQLTAMAAIMNLLFTAIKPVTDWLTHLANVLINEVLYSLKAVIAFISGSELSDGSKRSMVRGLGPPVVVAPEAKPVAVDTPVGKNITNVDMRGSKIVVKQDFRDADPDNVAYQMMKDITKQASARAQSGFVPALSR